MRPVFFVAVIYFLLAKFSFLTTLPSAPAGPALIWLPTGFAIAAITIFGYKIWPGIVLGSYLNSFPSHFGWAGTVGFILANTANPLIAFWIARKIMNREVNFFSRRDVTIFILSVIFVSSMTSASIGTATFYLVDSKPGDSYLITWITWWVSDFLGVLILTPLILAWKAKPPTSWKKAGLFEILMGSVLGSGIIISIFSMPFGKDTLYFVYWLIPFVIWTGLRLDFQKATTGIFILAIVIVLCTAFEIGPFVADTQHKSFLYVQSFLTVVSILSLLLIATVSELERAIRDRDDFFLLASHELNTPLSTLGMQSHFLRNLLTKGDLSQIPPLALRELIEINFKEVKKLTELVQNLLEAARIVTEKMKINRKEFSIKKLVNKVLEDFAPQIKNQELRIHPIEGDIVGYWDEEKLKFVFETLLSNALKFGAGKPIDLSLSLHGNKVIFTIQDYGIGISREQQSRIFERFGRLSQVKYYGGLGQRLFIAKTIISAHGGKIFLKSSPGAGSKFTVELPV